MELLSKGDETTAARLLKRQSAAHYYSRSSIAARGESNFYRSIEDYRTLTGKKLSEEDSRIATERSKAIGRALVFASVARLFEAGVSQSAKTLHLEG
jgi:hypothetical protein